MQTLYLAKPETREAMRQYIDRTGISGGKFERYSLKAPEIKVLYEMFRDADPVEAVILRLCMVQVKAIVLQKEGET